MGAQLFYLVILAGIFFLPDRHSSRAERPSWQVEGLTDFAGRSFADRFRFFLANLRCWRSKYVIVILNGAYHLCTAFYYLFLAVNTYKYSRAGLWFLQLMLLSAVSVICGGLYALACDARSLSCAESVDRQFTFASTASVQLFFFNLNVIAGRFMQDVRFYPDGCDKTTICESQGGVIVETSFAYACQIRVSWHTATSVLAMVFASVLTLCTLLQLTVVDAQKALQFQLCKSVQCPRVVVWSYWVLVLVSFTSSVCLIAVCFVVDHDTSSSGVLLLGGIVVCVTFMIINAGSRHFEACHDQRGFSGTPDVRTFRLFIFAGLILKVYVALYKTSIFEMSQFGYSWAAISAQIGLRVAIGCIFVALIFLAWATRPPQTADESQTSLSPPDMEDPETLSRQLNS